MPGEIDHIKELQNRLYTRDPDNIPKKKFGILHPVKQNVDSTWGDKNIPKDRGPQKVSVRGYKRFFLFSFLFFAIGLGLAAFSVFRGAVTLSSKNVDVVILGNSFVDGGEVLPIQVEIANRNSSDLINAELTLEYPKGATDSSGSEVARVTELLGTIGSGKTRSIGFSALLYGEQGLSRTIVATLSYNLAGSTATFQKKQSFSVVINSSPIALTISGPSVTAADQVFTLTIRSLFTGEQPLANPLVRVEYPNGFTFLSATPTAYSGGNTWAIGPLEKGQEKVITIKGKISGLEQDEKAFRVYLGTPISDTDSRIAVAYNSALHSLVIERPFIVSELNVGGGSKDVESLPIGSSINGSVSWRNMTGFPITNPTFNAVLSGEDTDSLGVQVVDGYYDDLLRTMTWTNTSNKDLAIIEPGEEGSLLFNITPTLSSYNKDITVSLSIEGTLPNLENQMKTIQNIDELTIRYAARIQFAAQALYSIGPIKNSGPYPPKSDKETTYTVTWTARPSDNPFSNMIASATLPTNVIWMGTISPSTEILSYNPDSREIKWSVGSLPKATSTPLSKSVSFQIKVRPTSTQVGADVPLLSETKITAKDVSANVPIDSTRPALSTILSTDPIYNPGMEKVVP